MKARLLAIYEDVEKRAKATSGEHAWWPCRRGCDSCCKRLADVPRFGRAEWELLREGLDALSPDVGAEIRERIGELARAEAEGRLPRHVTCPMLDAREGACLVYAHRPAACRTYGFYVERAAGLHCDMVTSAVAERGHATVVWGNQQGIDYALARLGGDAAPLPLTAWAASSSSPGSDELPAPPADPSSPSSAI